MTAGSSVPGRSAIAGESGRLDRPAVCLHGGAGAFRRILQAADEVREELVASTLDGLRAALAAAWDVLGSDGPALDAVVEAVDNLEKSGLFNAGTGAVPTVSGEVELDAGVMDGETGAAGGICASRFPAGAVRVARAVANLGGPGGGPILLAGKGADDFARSLGVDPREPLAEAEAAGGRLADERERHGTVGAVAVDAAGRLAAATSTGGVAGQLTGRVGDSAIPGAGLWAGRGTVSVSATGTGESFVVGGFAHRVEWNLDQGWSLVGAVDAALDVVSGLGGEGGAIALCPDGRFAARFNSAAMARAWRCPQGSAALLVAERR